MISNLHRAIHSLWTDSGLDGSFKAYWTEADQARYLTLSDGEATPGTPFPYCVYLQGSPSVDSRMTDVEAANRMLVDVPWTFRVYTTDQAGKSAKQTAADLVELIMSVIDGDPTTGRKPAELTLNTGSFLESQFQRDYGAQASDGFYAWTLDYVFRLDFPFAV